MVLLKASDTVSAAPDDLAVINATAPPTLNESRRPPTLHRLPAAQAQGERIAMLTCHDSSFTRLLDAAGVDASSSMAE